jgi:hypothetical protein
MTIIHSDDINKQYSANGAYKTENDPKQIEKFDLFEINQLQRSMLIE